MFNLLQFHYKRFLGVEKMCFSFNVDFLYSLEIRCVFLDSAALFLIKNK